MAILWLDLKNAYRSIPHSLVEEALKCHHVPNKITELIMDYYNNFQMRMVLGNTKLVWNKLEKGIITGCTISATIFAIAMNMLIKAAEVECRDPTTRSDLRHPLIREYMDDMTITTTSVIGARWLLKGIEKLITWTRMSINAAKLRSLVLKKGKLWDNCFKLFREYIPTIKHKLLKSLGKHFIITLKDAVAIQETRDSVEWWLNKIDRSGLHGRFKAWVYHHVVLSKLLWLLTIYEFTSYNVEQLEKRIDSRFRRWQGLPKMP